MQTDDFHCILKVWKRFTTSTTICTITNITIRSGVPRILGWEGSRCRSLEWEGSRCRRRRGGGKWGEGIPVPTGIRVWVGGCAPSQKIFHIFLLKITYFDAFWHIYFLNHTPMGVVLAPPNPLLRTPLTIWTPPPTDSTTAHGLLTAHWPPRIFLVSLDMSLPDWLNNIIQVRSNWWRHAVVMETSHTFQQQQQHTCSPRLAQHCF